MGLHKYPNISSYWSNNSLYKVNFKRIMSKIYYFLLLKALHFPEKEEGESSSSTTESMSTENAAKEDPRHKINLYLEKLAKNFQKYYDLGENITIDESLVKFKGRNSMKFYIPMKPHKYGFKIHLLCDSDTHFLYNMLFDPGRVGKDFIFSEGCTSLAESIVLKLVAPIKDNKKRNIFCDGWYSSVSLMKKLTKLGFLNTTVLRANSKDLPSKIKLEGYDKAYNDEILIQKYEGKKTIYFATNYKIDIEELRNIYNIKNRGVDTFDQLLEISSIQRRTLKWYKKIIMFGIDCCIINSKIMYELKNGTPITTVNFKERLAAQIFDRYITYKKKNKIKNSTFLIKNEISTSDYHNITQDLNNIGQCKQCSKKAFYICLECGINLHPECFAECHHNRVYDKFKYNYLL